MTKQGGNPTEFALRQTIDDRTDDDKGQVYIPSALDRSDVPLVPQQPIAASVPLGAIARVDMRSFETHIASDSSRDRARLLRGLSVGLESAADSDPIRWV